MARARHTEALTLRAARRDWQATLAKLDAASQALTGRSYGSNAKPAPPANRAQRRADERVRRRLERRARKQRT